MIPDDTAMLLGISTTKDWPITSYPHLISLKISHYPKSSKGFCRCKLLHSSWRRDITTPIGKWGNQVSPKPGLCYPKPCLLRQSSPVEEVSSASPGSGGHTVRRRLPGWAESRDETAPQLQNLLLMAQGRTGRANEETKINHQETRARPVHSWDPIWWKNTQRRAALLMKLCKKVVWPDTKLLEAQLFQTVPDFNNVINE